MSLTRTKASIALLLTGLFLVVGCIYERDTILSVGGGNPPKFTMKGSGKLVRLSVSGPEKQREGVGEIPYNYWVIEFKETGTARYVENLGSITYGEVPRGYVQSFPDSDRKPLPLLEDAPLRARVETMNANGDYIGFTIHDGKAVVRDTK